MTKRRLLCLTAVIVSLAALWGAWISRHPADNRLPGTQTDQRHLLRIWLASSIGGSESWLRDCLKDWEKSHPATLTYLRSVTPEELTREDAVLPDIVLYTPGTITAPESRFLPLKGIDGLQEPLLRGGRWQTLQYGLPLCYGAYALAIDSILEPDSAQTPAPTTLLGRAAPTAESEITAHPGYPLAEAARADTPLLAPRGCGLFTLACILGPDARPPQSGDFASTDAADVYRRFQARQAPSALLTTGQLTALTSLTSAGRGFPFRVMTADEVITDQVWLGSLTPSADSEAAALLSYLTGVSAQKKLSKQGLYTTREDIRLYVSGWEARIEQAAARALTVINAYIPAEETNAAAWHVWTGNEGFSDALLPLM